MTQAALSLVTENPSPAILSEREILRQYAEHLKRQSWCIDVSASPVKALHADSNYNAAMENFRYEFPSWARRNGVRVAPNKYEGFLNALTSKIPPLLPRVVGSALNPIPEKFFDRNGAQFANTYVPFAPGVPEKFEMPDILNNYLGRMFMNAQDRKHVTQFMADIIQNPTRRPQWCVVLTGEQGSGKSSIFRLVSAALGYRHTWENNQYTAAFEKFSEVLPDNLLVSFDDAVADRNTYQKLKQAITRTSMHVQLKGVQKLVWRDVYARILICSNSPRPIPGIEKGDRRLYVPEPSQHRESPEETAAFFVEFNEWLEQPSTPTVLYHWLKTVDLTDFVPGYTVKTETHAKMVGLSASVLETRIAEYVEDAPIFHNGTLLTYLAENGYRNPNPEHIKMIMATLNYESKRRKIEGGGEKQYALWQPVAKRSRALTSDEIEAIKTALHLTF